MYIFVKNKIEIFSSNQEDLFRNYKCVVNLTEQM